MSKVKYGKYWMCSYLLLAASVYFFSELSSMMSLQLLLHPIFSAEERTSSFHELTHAESEEAETLGFQHPV